MFTRDAKGFGVLYIKVYDEENGGIFTRCGCSLVVRIPRCGRGDLGSNPSSHTIVFFLNLNFYLFFKLTLLLMSDDVSWNI